MSREPRRYINRELSWLAFNERVLEEAEDGSNLLLERLKFVAIFQGNLDEFFMKRVAVLHRLLEDGYDQPGSFGYLPSDTLAAIESRSAELVERLYRCFEDLRRGPLRRERIAILGQAELGGLDRDAADGLFDAEVYPLMTPMAVDQSHPFPVLPSRTLCFAVLVRREGEELLAVLPLPTAVPRVVRLPGRVDEHRFVLLDELVRGRLGAFFQGCEIIESAVFRVMRDGELSIDEEDVSDLLEAVEKEVRGRPRARPVTLDVESSMSDNLLARLCERVGIVPPARVRRLESWLDLTFLFGLIAQTRRPDLQDPPLVPARTDYADIFDHIRQADRLVHLPYESFDPVRDLIERAADDPAVLAIKITLYRTYEQSTVVQALARAATRGKGVTVLVEIKASFDEERNIRWVRMLEQAGCHVVYGIPGMKIHAKLALVIRREEDGIRRYVHLATGNYNEATARVYTDIGFFTADEAYCRDVADVFNVISGYSLPPRWRTVITAPRDLRPFFFQLIDSEIENQRRFGNGLVFAKLNALQDRRFVDKLLEAARAGVRLKLLVRGICCLVPGVPGHSETIEVRSIVGRFLEHSRIYLFNNSGSPRVFLSSSDWMKRNMERRIELLFPVLDPGLQRELTGILDCYWSDSVKARVLGPDGVYRRLAPGAAPVNAQEELLARYARRSG
ncbi:MAG: polyphosphate kinase 1 [bacterium]